MHKRGARRTLEEEVGQALEEDAKAIRLSLDNTLSRTNELLVSFEDFC